MKPQKLIITRPHPFADQLAKALTFFPGNIITLPCITIQATPLPDIKHTVDYLIFISRNAAIHGHTLLNETNAQPIAIGPGTQTTLNEYGHTNSITPTQAPFDSEALLALPELTHCQNKRILIVRGGEGRPILGDTLKQRGAQVQFADVYERGLPDYPLATLQTAFDTPHNTLAICTSLNALENLYKLTKKAQIEISELKLCVISAKMVESARQLGCQQPILQANSAMDKDIVWTIKTLLP